MANKLTLQNHLAIAVRQMAMLNAIASAIALCCVVVADEASGDRRPSPTIDANILTIGSLAPALNIEHWISHSGGLGEVTELKEGKVYVIEFWATWCGPCIQAIPHLAEIQHRYRNDDVQVISISSEELDTVKDFLKRDYEAGKDSVTGHNESDLDRMRPKTYAELTDAYCLTVDPDRSAQNDYVEAAAQTGIPVAFLVGKSGCIEWIGHPMMIDQPLQQVIRNKWDRDKFATDFNRKQQLDMQLSKVLELANNGDFESAHELLNNVEADARDDLAVTAMAYRDNIGLMEMHALAGEGLIEDAIEMADKAIQNSTGPAQMRWRTQKYHMLLTARRDDDAAELLVRITKEGDVSSLVRMCYGVHELAESFNNVSPKLLAAAITAAETALKLKPDYIETTAVLARLVHRNGELDRAIALQSRVLATATRNRLAHVAFLKQLEAENSKVDLKLERKKSSS